MNRFGFEPDFGNLKTVLAGGRGWRVPNAELVIDREIKEGFLGRPVRTLADEIEFRYQAGYDYVWISVGMVDPAGTVNKELVSRSTRPDRAERQVAGEDERVWADERTGVIGREADLAAFPWPDPDRLDLSPFEEAERLLRPGMKVIAVLGKIFTAAWQLMGFEPFCERAYAGAPLVESLVERIGTLQVAVFRRIVGLDSVGAAWLPDDIAFRTGTMLAPDWFRRMIFPYYRRMADLALERDKPLIYHSDGKLDSVLDTLLETGFQALHPIEPESMDIYDLRRRVGRRLCLVGNISVDTLARGTREEVRELARDRCRHLGREGAYCLGSSNSVPNYIPVENYRAMLEAGAEAGRAG